MSPGEFRDHENARIKSQQQKEDRNWANANYKDRPRGGNTGGGGGVCLFIGIALASPLVYGLAQVVRFILA